MIPIASDALVTVENLKNKDTGLIVSDATLTGELQDVGTGAVLSSFSFTAKGGGKYNGIIPASVTDGLIQGTNYLIVVTAVDGVNTSVFHDTDVADYLS